MQAQTSSYREFIKDLVKGDTIMTKNFYVVVPYALAEVIGAKSIVRQFDALNPANKGGQPTALTDEEFGKCKSQLWQRMEFLAMGLKRCGLDVIPLTTPELIELFWAVHHPAEAEVGYYPEILPELLQ